MENGQRDNDIGDSNKDGNKGKGKNYFIIVGLSILLTILSMFLLLSGIVS